MGDGRFRIKVRTTEPGAASRESPRSCITSWAFKILKEGEGSDLKREGRGHTLARKSLSEVRTLKKSPEVGSDRLPKQ